MNQTSTQSETPLRKLMIPLLVCVLVGSVGLAWLAVRYRRNANLSAGAEIVQSLNTKGLDEYFPDQTELPRYALTALSRHARKRVQNQLVPTPANGWRYFVVMQQEDDLYEGLEVVVDKAGSDGRSLAGWFEVWTWNPNTRSGDYRIELFTLTSEDLVFTPIGAAKLESEEFVLDHDGQESTDAIQRRTSPSFLPPSHILPALLKVSHDQVRVARFDMLRSEPDMQGTFKTHLTDICLATTDPKAGPIQMQDAQWATQMRQPGTDLPESVFYFARAGQLIGIHHPHSGPTDIIEVQQGRLPLSNPPQAVLAMFATIVEREGWSEKLGWSEPPVPEASVDEMLDGESDDAPSDE